MKGDLKNTRWTQLKICSFLFCIFPFPGVKRMTMLYRTHSIHWWEKTDFYSEGLFMEVQLNYSFKRAYCQHAVLADSISPPARPCCIMEGEVSRHRQSSRINLNHSHSLWDVKVHETSIMSLVISERSLWMEAAAWSFLIWWTFFKEV